MRLRSDFFVAALLRRCGTEGVPAVLRRRGSAEAGAVFVKIDRLDGSADLFAPAPLALVADPGTERLFHPALEAVPAYAVEERMTREIRFDSDLWLVEIEDPDGRRFLDVANGEA